MHGNGVFIEGNIGLVWVYVEVYIYYILHFQEWLITFQDFKKKTDARHWYCPATHFDVRSLWDEILHFFKGNKSRVNHFLTVINLVDNFKIFWLYYCTIFRENSLIYTFVSSNNLLDNKVAQNLVPLLEALSLINLTHSFTASKQIYFCSSGCKKESPFIFINQAQFSTLILKTTFKNRF